MRCSRRRAPRCPSSRRSAPQRYERDWGLAPDPARLLAYEPQWGDYFEAVAAAADGGDGRAAATG